MHSFSTEGSIRAAARRSGHPPLPRRAAPWRRAAVLLAWLALGAAHAGPGDLPPPAVVPVATDASACTELFGEGDPRLFDFVDTRKTVDFTAWQGRPIGSISYVTLPVFNTHDTGEDYAIYRGANFLHIATRDATLRKQVLFHEGDPFDDDLVRQSERILRNNNYIYDAMVLPARVCPDHVDVLVVARDIWTLQPTANFNHTGGQSSSAFGFSEDNLLGNGQTLSLAYESNPDRSSTVVSFADRHLVDGHSELQLSHGTSSDGGTDELSLQRPFYAFDTPYSGGIALRDQHLTETTTTAGATTNRYDHQQQFGEAFFGWSTGVHDNAVNRWRIGVTRDADYYYDQQPGSTDPLPGDRVLVYPWVELEHEENRYLTLSNVSRMFRNEDIDVGTGWRVRGGMTNGRLGSQDDGVLLAADWHDTLGSGVHHLLRNSLHADVFMYEIDGKRRDSLYGYQARYDYFIDANDRWLGNLKLDLGEGLSADNQLETGGENGLLGYPDGWQHGDRRALFSIERRHFLDAHPLNLFRIAAASFFEVGRAWDSTGAIAQSDSVLADIGIGLRLNMSKARSNNILQFNLAFPLTDRASVDGMQWSIFAGEAF